ncbi:MAG: hypothetical protein FWH01_17760 [Oscillospiraceae bacterium]|nr:hypothetical protein [Oscillospiraceae bacterium]
MECFLRALANPKKKYIFLLALLFFLANAYWNLHAVKAIKAAQVEEKYIEVVDIVDTIAAAVNADAGRPWLEHERNIADSAEHVDSLHQVYAAAFRGAGLEPITERHYETSPLEPFEFEEARAAVSSGEERGRFEIGYAPEGQGYRVMHLYYRWMPSYSPPGERYLLVAGVTEHSIRTRIPALYTAGQWASTAIMSFLFVMLVYLNATLGHFWLARGKDHWRGKRGG